MMCHVLLDVTSLCVFTSLDNSTQCVACDSLCCMFRVPRYTVWHVMYRSMCIYISMLRCVLYGTSCTYVYIYV